MVDADSLLGVVLDGRYRVEVVIGVGGMGTVYRATQLNVDRPVAIKVLKPELTRGGGDMVQRFEREARLIARLAHPHILRLIDFGRTEQGAMYIVTELVQGEPLNKILERGNLSARRTAKILHQICAAMEDFHAAGIVHRDLKPANLIIERVNGDDFVRVLDFGIARDDEGPVLTMSQMLLGTPAYMSPEQSRGEAATLASDLYSLGVIAYECLSGRPPFFGDAPLGILLKHVHDPPPPLAELLPAGEVPPELLRLVMELLAKSPADRPQSATEVRRRLERVEEGPTQAVKAVSAQVLYLAAPTPEPLRSAALLPTEQATPASVFGDPASGPLVAAAPEAATRPKSKYGLAALVTGGLLVWTLVIGVLAALTSSPDDDAAARALAEPSASADAAAMTSSASEAATRRRPSRAGTRAPRASTREDKKPAVDLEDALLTIQPLLASGEAAMGEVFIDGTRRSAGTNIQLKLEPGTYLVEVVGSGGLRAKRRVRLSSGESRRETFTLEAPGAPRRNR